jgi:hypothetical protein
MTIDFSQLEGQGIVKSISIIHHPFKKRSLIEKNLDIAHLDFIYL